MKNRKTLEAFVEPSKEPVGRDDPTMESLAGKNIFFRDSPAFYNLSSLVTTIDEVADLTHNYRNRLHVGGETVGFSEVAKAINGVFDEYCKGNTTPDMGKVPEQLRAAVQACLDDLATLSPEEIKKLRIPKNQF